MLTKEEDLKLTQQLLRLETTILELRRTKALLYKLANDRHGWNPNHNEVWTSDHETKIVRDYKLGIPVNFIALRYGRWDSAVVGRLRKLKAWNIQAGLNYIPPDE